ncbi:carbonic anhydrase [Nitratifractor salsuginis]|uniref:Carbonic anhydrase n=1 Tax=Nitratifractor salsuginis (strain DSM 16511 / JCM 12458 / E9I37-1) TaxID=749222 RepID=E6X298_NITSE|nr:carbonic anhydrase [Nitratifractor salsuginis]ADV46033.1 Carbonate dehydratase [Nitratifractor salsuginis DSM 16511]
MPLDAMAHSHKKFKEEYGKKYIQLFKDLAEKGQAPKTLFISCSDSRVVPNLITYTKPGDLFVTRNIGNFIPPYDPERDNCATAAVIEYALVHLNVETIIVCGHTHCGACEALYHEIPDSDEELNLRRWMRYGEEAKEQALALIGDGDKDDLLRATEKFNVIDQLTHLLSYPAVKKRVHNHELHVMGWYYHVHSGNLEYFNPLEYRFVPVEDLKKPARKSKKKKEKSTE